MLLHRDTDDSSGAVVWAIALIVLAALAAAVIAIGRAA
jgi:MYXO-CTERM domain-containing protein